MKIIDVIATPGVTGFYFDDQEAIRRGAQEDGFTYQGEPLTPGFNAIRQAGESISIMLMLENGQIAHGDCAAVQYSGVGGRDPLFLAQEYIPVIQRELKPILVGRELTAFRDMAKEFDALILGNGKRLHTAIRYGITQALLDAVAKSQCLTMAEIVSKEYNITMQPKAIPIFTQTGDDRYTHADKCIIKGAQVLPHGLINNKLKFGDKGEALVEYVKWLSSRVQKLGEDGYEPILHIDVYGALGIAFDNNTAQMAQYLKDLGEAAWPLKLRIEGPMDAGSKSAQLREMGKLYSQLKELDTTVEIIADEWCNTLEDIRDFVQEEVCHMVQIKTPDLGGINNTIEAVLYCKENGVKAYMGGTCNETERSSQVCVHAAIATQPDQILAKPGMGVDEGLMITYNEMQRALAIIKNRLNKGCEMNG
ncbi:methylaspartate ammonia-lyase [Desulfitispora alkaliphila]|uniref:methylaspartate ammonia-lyase n=1 Tax=Desulfitispora alkaliphila TaxID=622674 RepID=UPI003D198C35